jgi:hypothetical protein
MPTRTALSGKVRYFTEVGRNRIEMGKFLLTDWKCHTKKTLGVNFSMLKDSHILLVVFFLYF